ncbi:MAG: single-stranded DNA-binding protein [Clostridia bacterium]|nr:single-stranded DNA-binding protein [Clostridia bacterium]
MANKVFLIGNLCKNPELTETPNGVAVCKFSIAVNRDYANANGEKETDFFNITAWRKTAENCGKYLKKGHKVAVFGALQNRTYDDKEGVKHTITDIVANEVEFLTPKQQEEPDTQTSVRYRQQEMDVAQRPSLTEIDDSELPF